MSADAPETLSAAELAVVLDHAREYLRGDPNFEEHGPESLAWDFARGLVQLSEACVVGYPCAKHGGAVHGQEAEALRSGVEQILGNTSAVRSEDEAFVAASTRKALIFLLDRVDARDSLAFLERHEELMAIGEAVLAADISKLPPAIQAARLAYQFPKGDL